MTRGRLSVVATPLGNLADLTPRAADTLRAADLVAAEDTRRARILLQHVGARPRTMSYHAHSPPSRLDAILAALERGASVALVTDAGTPTVSDPGAELVRRAREAGHAVEVVPGASAVTAALSVSGLPADRYLFLGFPPRRGSERRALLEAAARSPWTVVLFEAGPRLADLLDDLAGAADRSRRAAVGRELTKLHEEVRTGTLDELAGYYRSHEPRGEITVVLEGGRRESPESPPADAIARARELLGRGLSRKDVARLLADELGVPRNEAYRLVTRL
ncbi:MAG TPA: 16S rRNA (cytidine(1402)-2'-O)-methyltransferase [Gemmatimonadales bacterium]|nr:16S rRNA (cytidine(1402)-2'-O)-methyltransferase [Gemmatimonadales bacterium]